MDIKQLSKDEKHVLRGLSLLGDITVDRDLLSKWIGGYPEAINALAEGGWIQLADCGSVSKMSMRKDIRDLAQEALKPSLSTCGWVKPLLNEIADDLAGQKENARINMSAKGRVWIDPDMFERAKYMMQARLALNVIEGFDYADIESLNCAIDFLSRSIGDDARCAVYFGLCEATAILERIAASPSFGSLTDKQKFGAYNISGIVWLGTLVDLILKLSEECQSALFLNRIFQSIFVGSGNEEYIEKASTAEEKPLIADFYAKTSLIEGRIVEHYTKAEQLANGLAGDEKALCQQRIFLPLMDCLASFGRGERSMMVRYNSANLFRFIDEFESRNTLSEETRDAFRAAYERYNAKLFPDRNKPQSDDADEAEEADGLHESGGEYAAPHADGSSAETSPPERADYYNRICDCILISDFDEITAQILEDKELSSDKKIHELQRIAHLLGYSPFKNLTHDYEDELRELTERELRDGNPDKSDLLLYCPDAEKQRRAGHILSKVSHLIESSEVTLHGYCRHCAQLLMLAADMDDSDGVAAQAERLFSNMPEDDGGELEFVWKLLLPVVFSVGLTEKLYSRNQAAAANEVVKNGLMILEAEVKKPHRTKQNQYDIFGLAVSLAEGAGDTGKIEHYKLRRSEALGLGYHADIYDAMGREC